MSTPDPTARAIVRLSEGGDIIAAVPHLLGFHPTDSIVVIALHQRTDTSSSLGLVQRADLLPPGPHTELFCAQMIGNVVTSGADRAHVVIVGGGEPADGGLTPPRADLVSALGRVCEDAGVGVTHAMWTPSTSVGVHWRCYTDLDCGGVVPDPHSTPLAAAVVMGGHITYRSKDELLAQLAPPDPQALERRAGLLAEPGEELAPAALHGRVLAAVHAATQGRLPEHDDEFVALTRAVSHLKVRDALLSTASGEHAEGARALWLALVRGTPAPHRAPAATLLAIAAWHLGEGPLVAGATANALAAQPGYPLATLLEAALDRALPPEWIRDACLDAAAQAAEDLTTPAAAHV